MQKKMRMTLWVKIEYKKQCGNYGNLLSTLFDKNYVKTMVILKKFLNRWFDEIFFRLDKIYHFSHCEKQSVEIAGILSRIFGKNFVKVTSLLNKLLKSWFDEKIFWWERISRFSTLWEIYCHTFVTFLTKNLWKHARIY